MLVVFHVDDISTVWSYCHGFYLIYFDLDGNYRVLPGSLLYTRQDATDMLSAGLFAI